MNEKMIAGIVMSFTVMSAAAFAEPHLPGRDQLAGYRPQATPAQRPAAAAAAPTAPASGSSVPVGSYDPTIGATATTWNRGLGSWLTRVSVDKQIPLTAANIAKLTYAYKVQQVVAAGGSVPSGSGSTRQSGTDPAGGGASGGRGQRIAAPSNPVSDGIVPAALTGGQPAATSGTQHPGQQIAGAGGKPGPSPLTDGEIRLKKKDNAK